MSKLEDTINYHLSEDYACTRVWEAWNVGTMTEDDFTPLTETDRASEIAEDIKDLIRDLIDETFDKDDAKAYELWQKVEKL